MIATIVVNALKNILLKTCSEAFFKWLFFWAAQMLVDSTKTTKDDEFLAQVKKTYEQSK
tara:strand:+ start:287 stop:463 length:177 start_codon:yes stop_codon:yes gene_type:complete